MQEGHPHDPKRNKRLDGVFFNPKGNVVSLKRRTVTIELNKRAFTALYRRSVFVAFLVVVCGGIVGFYSARQTRADTNLYPQTCLGGWNDPAHAQGVPELDGSDGSAYNDTNSASVRDSLSDLYCGDFAGDIPDGTKPTAVVVHMSWHFLPASDTVEVSATPSDVSSSTDDVLQAPPDAVGVGTSTSDVQQDVPVPFQESAPADAPVPDAVPPESAPQSMLPRWLSFLMPPIAYAQDASSSPQHEDAVLEVSYTLDGSTWNVLGTVTRFNFADSSFAIPIDAISGWHDLGSLQIRVRTLSSTGDIGTVYLDGMTMTVAYVEAPVIKKDTTTPYALTDGAVIPEGELPSAIVHPVMDDHSTNVIFYQDYGTNATYVAEGEGHGDAPLSEYYAPLPGPGKYVMLEYQNDGRSFECDGITVSQCAGDPHFIARTDFEVVPDATSSDTIAPTP